MKLITLAVCWGVCAVLLPLPARAQTNQNLTDSVFLSGHQTVTLPAINLAEILNANSSLVELAAFGSDLTAGFSPFKTQVTRDITWQLKIPSSIALNQIQVAYTIDPLASVTNVNNPTITAQVTPKQIQSISTDTNTNTQIIEGTATVALDLSQVRFSGKYSGKLLIRVTRIN